MLGDRSDPLTDRALYARTYDVVSNMLGDRGFGTLTDRPYTI